MQQNKFKEFWSSKINKRDSKTYITSVDVMDHKGNFWMSGTTRNLTPDELEHIKTRAGSKAQYITEYKKPEAKRMVELINPNGSKEVMTWGEYLRRVRSKK